MRRFGLFALAFASGFAVLTIEIAGARLMAPVYGLSAVPWTAVIGVILAALAVGSHVGGRLADADAVPLAGVLALAGLTGVLPVVGGGLPWMARDVLGFVPGAIASAVVLFAPPVLCLGAVVPYLVRADTESLGAVGRRVGDVSAAATAGSIAGTFVTGFVLLPAFPLPVLLGLTAASLFVLAAIAGRLLGRGAGRVRLVVSALAATAVGYGAARPPEGTLHEQQTVYSAVRVTERTWSDGRLVREIFQNGGSSSAEYVDTGEPVHAYVGASLELLGPKLDELSSALVLGGAALTLPVELVRRRPGLEVTVVEIDPAVTELAARYFSYGSGRYRGGIRVVHEDARVYLRASEEAFDLVYLDVFDHLVTVPWTMVTEEALSDMAERLAPGGLLMANVLSPLAGPGVGFLQRLRATFASVFAEHRVYPATPGTDPRATQNLIFLASRHAGAIPPSARSQTAVEPAGRPLTDAWAPVEYLQAQVFLGGLGWRWGAPGGREPAPGN
jgi:predicted membrane-bound spermidine synthase